MEKQTIPPEMTEVLNTGHFAYLCTTDQDNQPHITPMFFAFDEKNNTFYVQTSSDSKKIKNLQVNSKVSLSVDIRDETNPFNNRGVMAQGKATVEEYSCSISPVGDEELMAACEAFQKKYPVLLREAKFPVTVEKFSETLIRIIPDKMTYWKGPNFITVNFNKQKKSQRLI
jgi:nitroimidazol reductase NimA-like FMN-containing flavoprotein (pyridoxamine 5'-phosphate oxidase superfamily)